MKRLMKYMRAAAPLAVVCAAMVSTTACKLDNDFTYDKQGARDAVFFDYEQNRAKTKSLYCTFYDDAALPDSVFRIPVRLSGMRADHDRTFAVKADTIDEATLAPGTLIAGEGDNFTLKTTGTIPAGEGVGYVDITLENADAMAANTYVVRLRLVESPDFLTGYTNPDPKFDLNFVDLRFSRMLLMPDWWNPDIGSNWTSLLKQWSRVANELFRVATGETGVPLSNVAGETAETMNTIQQFTGMIKDPERWIRNNATGLAAGYTLVALGPDPATGFEMYEFYDTAAPERKWSYVVNTVMSTDGINTWFDEEGNPSIYY